MAAKHIHHESPQKSKKGRKTLVFFFIFLLLAGAAALEFYRNQTRYLFLIHRDRYAMLERQASVILNEAKSNDKAALEHLASFQDSLLKLRHDHPSDAYLPYLHGKLLSDTFFLPVEKNPALIVRLLFDLQVDHYSFPKELDAGLWKRSILLLRSALAMESTPGVSEQSQTELARLYFWGGLNYWETGHKYISLEKTGEERENDIYVHLYQIILQKQPPDWEVLGKTFDEPSLKLLKSIYFLRSGNTPLAYSLLRELHADTEHPEVRNMALYVSGHQFGKRRNLRQQLYYYRAIDPEDFLRSNPWFLEEYHFLLRFFGAREEASRFLARYEPLVLNPEKFDKDNKAEDVPENESE